MDKTMQKCIGYRIHRIESTPLAPTPPPQKKIHSLYTDVVLIFFSFFSKTSAGARERKIKNDFLLPLSLTPSAGGQ